MFGRIRASPSSLDTLEGSPPSKILKDDSFSIYEATLMKLKLGAKRDTPSVQIDEEEEFTKDCSVTDEVSMDVDFTPATEIASNTLGVTTLMDTDYCSSSITNTSPNVFTRFGESVSTENNLQQPRQNNVSILHFFNKIKDPGYDSSSSKKNSSCGSASSSGSVASDDTRSELCE